MNHNAHIITHILDQFRAKLVRVKVNKDGRFNKGQKQGPWLTANREMREETGNKSFAPPWEYELGQIEKAMLANKSGQYGLYGKITLYECLNYRNSRW